MLQERLLTAQSPKKCSSVGSNLREVPGLLELELFLDYPLALALRVEYWPLWSGVPRGSALLRLAGESFPFSSQHCSTPYSQDHPRSFQPLIK